MNNKPIRHGEVFLQPVEKMPENRKAAKYDLFIVGHSETGHHHVLESNTKFEVAKTSDQELYIRLFEPGRLVHKKTVNRHNDLTLGAGVYKVIRKKEYDPFQKAHREVWD